MRLTNWMRTMGMMGLGLAAMALPARGQGPSDLPGPIDNLGDLQQTGRMVFKLADENNDGQISQKEAVDAGNLVIGGFFFRADTNGDGVVSKEEARLAREDFLAQRPLARIAFERNQGALAGGAGAGGAAPAAGSPLGNAQQMFETILDSNHDGNLQASEVRQIIQTTVTATFAQADTNRDGQLSPSEVNAAIIGMANAAAQAAFAAADTDHNGQISQQEFNQAIVQPASAVFRTLDANRDGQISPQEAQAARQAVMQQVRNLRVPEPANSARNLINSGADPNRVAPTPTFPQPGQPGSVVPPGTPGTTTAPATTTPR